MPRKTIGGRRAYREENKDTINARQRAWRAEHIDECRKKQREYVARTKEIHLEYRKKYKLNNPDAIRASDKRKQEKHKIKIVARKKIYQQAHKDRIAKHKHQYYLENKDIIKAKSTQRRYLIQNRIVIWANMEDIIQIYKNCPEGYHVDHVVPLQGKNVCGLHVEYNLQYLTAYENLSKGNKFPYSEYI